MDPFLFRQQLEPLKNSKYDMDEILNICYPLRGEWTWDMLVECTNSMVRIFKLVHMVPDKFLVVESDWITDNHIDHGDPDYIYDERWGICWAKEQKFKTSYLFRCLEQLIPIPQGNSAAVQEWSDGSDSTSSEHTVSISEESVCQQIANVLERDSAWRNRHPAFNPRLVDDLEAGHIDPPRGFNVSQTVEFINSFKDLKDGDFLAADGSGDVEKEGLEEFGVYGKLHCLKSVKMVVFLKSHIDEYTLEIDTTQWVEKAERRTNPWKWLRVGPGWHRDFEWMFLGDQDCITATIRSLEEIGYTPLARRSSGIDFEFDPSLLFKLSAGKCLNIDNGKAVISKKADPYNFISDDMSKDRVLNIRGYIHDYFVGLHPEKYIPGKKNKWAKQFFKALKKGEVIDFNTLTPIKYSAITNMTYNVSNMGFAIPKTEVNFKIRDVELAIKKYKSK